MGLVVESFQTAGSGNASSVVVTKPTDLAVGDLMIAQLSIAGTGRTITLPSGFAQEVTVNNVRQTQISFKVADSADVSASDFAFSWDGGTANNTIRLIRITGNATTTPISASGGQSNGASTTVTTPSITPNGLNLILFFANASGSTVASVSGYAIPTTDPSWTELYDGTDSGGIWLAMAYGERNAITATGEGTATLNASAENHGFLVAVQLPPDVTVSPAVIDVSASVQAPAVVGSAVVSPAVVNLTASVQAPTLTQEASKFSNQTKNNAANVANQPKT